MDYPQVFSKIFMIPDFVRGHFIQWELDTFFNGAQPYNFTLQVSQTIDFSEIAYEIPVGDTFFAIDNSNYKQSWSLNYNYRILLVTGDNTKYYSNPVVFGHTNTEQRKYAMASEIIRKEFLLCRFAGHEAWLLKRKSYGATAKQTVDPVSGVPIADDRNSDLGVGIEGGYFSPVPCAYTIDTAQSDKQLDPQGLGVKETADVIARLPGYPTLDVRDILCTNIDGYRYDVLTKNIVYFPGTGIPVSQKVSLRLIPTSDTIYNIPVPVDLYE
jgi:hypothetical protein